MCCEFCQVSNTKDSCNWFRTKGMISIHFGLVRMSLEACCCMLSQASYDSMYGKWKPWWNYLMKISSQQGLYLHKSTRATLLFSNELRVFCFVHYNRGTLRFLSNLFKPNNSYIPNIRSNLSLRSLIKPIKT